MNENEEELVIEVPAMMRGVRLDRAVAMMADVSRSTAAELLEAGRVQVDGTVATVGKSTVREGSVLTIALLDVTARRVAAEEGVVFSVVYADDDVAVIDKPAGLVVHPGAGHTKGTLVGGLLARFPELADLVASGVFPVERPGIVHRLDKGTSGLLVVARSVEAYEALTGQLATRTMERRYIALVEGDVEEERGEVDAPIGRSAKTPTKMAVAADGKPARTRYMVQARRPGPPPTTLLELSLQSGRTHQIRVHMAAIGHPVVGDARYGKVDKRLASGRFFLHAWKLAFEHPRSGERMEFEVPLPPDLQGVLAGQG